MMTPRGFAIARNALFGLSTLVAWLVAAPLQAQESVFTTQGPADGALFGSAIDVLGDVDGDGVGELLVGEPGQKRVWILSGKDGQAVRVLTAVGNWQTNFGHSVAALGDVNGDEVPDSAVSPGGHAPLVFYSGTDGSWIRSVDVGLSELANVGDINQDGLDDLAGLGPTNSATGPPLIVVSGADGETLVSTTSTGPGRFSGTTAAVGDLDEDGVPDIGYAMRDRLTVLSGETKLPLWTRAYSGTVAISSAGDINMDGVPDVAVGQPDLTTPNGTVGAVIIYSGTNGAQLRVIVGPTPQGFLPPGFGSAVGSAGDVNSDGYPDLLVGSPRGENPSGVVTGSATMISGFDGSELYTLYGDGQNDDFGTQVAAGQDLDGDGFFEFAITSTRGPATHPLQGPGYVRLFTEAHPSYTTFGIGCSGSAGTTTLSVVDLPQVGQWFSIRIDNLVPFQLGVIATGFSDELWAPAQLPLPLELGYLGFPGCHLLVSPDIQSAAGSTLSGTANWGFQMPDLPWLYGFEFYNQAFFLDPGGVHLNIVGSNAGKARVGS